MMAILLITLMIFNATMWLPSVRNDKMYKEIAQVEHNKMYHKLNILIQKEYHIRDKRMISI